MTTRVEGSTTYAQGWDAENRLTTVTVNGQTTTFVYDGDGNRVKAPSGPPLRGHGQVQNGQTTVYIGALFEKNVSTGVVTTYYFAGGQRVAMRQGGVLYYLHGDHPRLRGGRLWAARL